MLFITFTAGMSPFSMLTKKYDISDISLLYILENLSFILIFFHVFKEYFEKEFLC